jgi:hypothetical protein
MSTAELEKVTKAWPPLSRAVRVPRTENDYNELVELLDRVTDQVGEDSASCLTSDLRLLTSDLRLPTSDFRLPTSELCSLGFHQNRVAGIGHSRFPRSRQLP